MGTLRVRFVADINPDEQARILATLRKLKATPRVRPSRRTEEEWIFDTALLPTPTAKKARRHRVVSDRQWLKRYRTQMWLAIERVARTVTNFTGDPDAGWHDAVASWNGDPWTWERIRRAEALAAAVAFARSCSATCAPFPTQTKGEGMPNYPKWEDYDRELQELYVVAADLVAGRGGPEQYRARQSDPRLLMPAFGKTPLIVGVWDEPYGPLAAMCVAAFILHGQGFEDRLARLGLGGDLIEAFELLEHQYGPRTPRVADRASPTSLAAALEAPSRGESLLTLTPKKATSRIAAPPSRPTLTGGPPRRALPDLGGRS